jgi:hypothetical protein
MYIESNEKCIKFFCFCFSIADSLVFVVVVVVVDKDMVLKRWQSLKKEIEIDSNVRLGTEDQLLTVIGGTTVADVGMWRLRSLPIAAGTILWSLPAFVDDNEGPVEWLLLEMITVGSTKRFQ